MRRMGANDTTPNHDLTGRGTWHLCGLQSRPRLNSIGLLSATLLASLALSAGASEAGAEAHKHRGHRRGLVARDSSRDPFFEQARASIAERLLSVASEVAESSMRARNLSKSLERALNAYKEHTVSLGNEVRGVQAAARRLQHKVLQDLDGFELRRLSALGEPGEAPEPGDAGTGAGLSGFRGPDAWINADGYNEEEGLYMAVNGARSRGRGGGGGGTGLAELDQLEPEYGYADDGPSF